MTRLVPSNKHDAIYVLRPAEQAGHLKMALFGSFHVEGPRGENLTPRGQKARALLALVALAKRGQRSRLWLCSKLWSDRATEQAYASLRQCLTEIRRALGIYCADAFITDQFNVSLNLGKISVDAVDLRLALVEKDGPERAEIPEDEFLEGLNVGDEEFEEWLAIERSRWADVREELERIQLAARTAWLTADPEPLRVSALHH